MRHTAIVLSLLFFICSPTAHACSYDLNATASYQQVELNYKSIIAGEDVIIALVKASVISEEDVPQNRSHFPTALEDSKLLNMEINVVQYLKGKGLDNVVVQHPKMFEHAREKQSKNARMIPTFRFWDGLLLSFPTSGWYGDLTSCGPSFTRTLAPDQIYLAIGSSTFWQYFEPVTGPQHPLVQDILKIAKGIEPNKLARQPVDFFKHIDGYSEIEFIACPTLEDTKYGVFERSSWDNPGESFQKYITILDSHKAEPIEMGDFYAHETGQGLWNPELCRVGDRYFVFHEFIGTPQHQSAIFGTMALFFADDRFLKIDNGYVDMRDVKSQIDILGPELLPVQYLKDWIKGAATE